MINNFSCNSLKFFDSEKNKSRLDICRAVRNDMKPKSDISKTKSNFKSYSFSMTKILNN